MNMINDGGPAFPVWELNGQGKPDKHAIGLDNCNWLAQTLLRTPPT